MKKLLLSVFGIFFCNTMAWAEDINANMSDDISSAVLQDKSQAPVTENKEATEDVPDNGVVVKAAINTDTKKPEFEVIRQTEVKIVPLPACDDERLINEVKEYAKDYFDSIPNLGTLHRRHRHFVLQNLNNFAQENVANYKTMATAPVSDIIADIKINKGIAEENLLLCKNQSKEPHAARVYLLVYPEGDEYYHVRIINLVYRQKLTDDTSFKYLR